MIDWDAWLRRFFVGGAIESMQRGGFRPWVTWTAVLAFLNACESEAS